MERRDIARVIRRKQPEIDPNGLMARAIQEDGCWGMDDLIAAADEVALLSKRLESALNVDDEIFELDCAYVEDSKQKQVCKKSQNTGFHLRVFEAMNDVEPEDEDLIGDLELHYPTPEGDFFVEFRQIKQNDQKSNRSIELVDTETMKVYSVDDLNYLEDYLKTLEKQGCMYKIKNKKGSKLNLVTKTIKKMVLAR